jgi:hypothetical protein
VEDDDDVPLAVAEFVSVAEDDSVAVELAVAVASAVLVAAAEGVGGADAPPTATVSSGVALEVKPPPGSNAQA